jgi:hypothetical protein
MSESKYTSPKGVTHYRFLDSTKRKNGRANRALREDGPATKLLDNLVHPHHYSLRYHHLGISKILSGRHLIYDHETIEIWLMVIKRLIRPPYFYKFEVGEKGGLHVHLIADVDAGLLHIPRPSRVVRPLQDRSKHAKALLVYLSKPSVPKNDDALKEYKEAIEELAKENRRPPRVSGYVGIRKL